MGDLNASALQQEGSLYIGIILAGILFGFFLITYFATLYSLSKCKVISRRRRIFCILYSSLLLLLTTIIFAATSLQGQLMWVVHQDNLNGLEGSLEYNESAPLPLALSTVASTALFFIVVSDSMLLTYRCYIIFDSRLWVVLAPSLCIIAFFILAILEAVNQNHGLPKGLELAQVAVSMPANMLATVMISIRIILVSRHIDRYANHHWERQFTSIAAILVESAAPGAVIWILAIILQAIIIYSKGIDIDWDPAIMQVWRVIIPISPQLIMLRTAMGTAWDKDTSRRLSKITLKSVDLRNEAIGQNSFDNSEIRNSDDLQIDKALQDKWDASDVV